MNLPTSFTQTLPDFQPGDTRISFKTRLDCIRKMRELNALSETKTDFYKALENAARLVPVGQTPAFEVLEAAGRDGDALLGCGSAAAVSSFCKLLPAGTESAKAHSFVVKSAAGLITPEVAQAATLYDTLSLHQALLPLTIAKPAWTEYWTNWLRSASSLYIPASTLLELPTAPGDAQSFAAVFKTLIAQLASKDKFFKVTPFKIELADKWLDLAATAHLVDPNLIGMLFKPLPAKTVTDPEAKKIKSYDSLMAHRALFALQNCETPLSLEEYRAMSQQDRVQKLLQGAPSAVQKKAADLPALAKRKKALDTFINTPNAPLDEKMFKALTQRYCLVVDTALESNNTALQNACAQEAKALVNALDRDIADEAYANTPSIYECAVHTGSMSFVLTARKLLLAWGQNNPPLTTWDACLQGFGQHRTDYNLSDLARRGNAKFATWLAPLLNRVDSFTFLTLLQYKTDTFLKVLDTLSSATQKSRNILVSQDPSQGVGQMLVSGYNYQTSLGNTMDMWNIQDPELRLKLFERFVEGNGFMGRPGKEEYEWESENLPQDGFLLHCVYDALTNTTTLGHARKEVPEDYIVHKLPETFLVQFDSIESFVKTPKDKIDALIASFSQRALPAD